MKREPKPMFDHIVLISLDTLRSDCIERNPVKLWPEKYGLNRRLKTSVLDTIADEGCFFANCITAAPYTSAAHSSIFSGQWPLRHGCYEVYGHPLRAETIFTHGRRLGLHTACTVDFPLTLGHHLGITNGIQDYLVEDEAALVERLDPTVPSISFVHFGGMHIPYGFHNIKYGGEDYRRKLTELEAELDDTSQSVEDRILETYRDREDLDMLIRYKRVVQHHYAAQRYTRLFGLYLDGIERFLEHRFESFWSRLTTKLAGTHSLVVLFGDHGEEYDRDSYGHHNSINEGVLRVPLIFWGTGVKPGLFRRRVRSIDVLPTVADLADAEAGGQWRSLCNGVDGSSLAATVTSGASYPERPAIVQAFTSEQREYVDYQQRLLSGESVKHTLRHVKCKEAVYSGTHKLGVHYYDYSDNGGIGGLMSREPQRTLSLIEEGAPPKPCSDASKMDALCEILEQHNARFPLSTAPPLDITNDTRTQLGALGYRV